jgi:hypothetical protein
VDFGTDAPPPIERVLGPGKDTIAARPARQIECVDHSLYRAFAGTFNEDVNFLTAGWRQPVPALNDFGQM